MSMDLSALIRAAWPDSQPSSELRRAIAEWLSNSPDPQLGPYRAQLPSLGHHLRLNCADLWCNPDLNWPKLKLVLLSPDSKCVFSCEVVEGRRDIVILNVAALQPSLPELIRQVNAAFPAASPADPSADISTQLCRAAALWLADSPQPGIGPHTALLSSVGAHLRGSCAPPCLPPDSRERPWPKLKSALQGEASRGVFSVGVFEGCRLEAARLKLDALSRAAAEAAATAAGAADGPLPNAAAAVSGNGVGNGGGSAAPKAVAAAATAGSGASIAPGPPASVFAAAAAGPGAEPLAAAAPPRAAAPTAALMKTVAATAAAAAALSKSAGAAALSKPAAAAALSKSAAAAAAAALSKPAAVAAAPAGPLPWGSAAGFDDDVRLAGPATAEVEAAAAVAWPGEDALHRVRRRAALLLAAVGEPGCEGHRHAMLMAQMGAQLRLHEPEAVAKLLARTPKRQLGQLLHEEGEGEAGLPVGYLVPCIHVVQCQSKGNIAVLNLAALLQRLSSSSDSRSRSCVSAPVASPAGGAGPSAAAPTSQPTAPSSLRLGAPTAAAAAPSKPPAAAVAAAPAGPLPWGSAAGVDVGMQLAEPGAAALEAAAGAAWPGEDALCRVRRRAALLLAAVGEPGCEGHRHAMLMAQMGEELRRHEPDAMAELLARTPKPQLWQLLQEEGEEEGAEAAPGGSAAGCRAPYIRVVQRKVNGNIAILNLAALLQRLSSSSSSNTAPTVSPLIGAGPSAAASTSQSAAPSSSQLGALTAAPEDIAAGCTVPALAAPAPGRQSPRQPPEQLLDSVLQRRFRLTAPAPGPTCAEGVAGAPGGAGAGADAKAAVRALAMRCIVRQLARAPPPHELPLAQLGAQVLLEVGEAARSKLGTLRDLCSDAPDVFVVELKGKGTHVARLVNRYMLKLAADMAASAEAVLMPALHATQQPPLVQPQPLPQPFPGALEPGGVQRPGQAAVAAEPSQPPRGLPRGPIPVPMPVPIPLPLPDAAPAATEAAPMPPATAAAMTSAAPNAPPAAAATMVTAEAAAAVHSHGADDGSDDTDLPLLSVYDTTDAAAAAWQHSPLPYATLQTVADPYGPEIVVMLQHCHACPQVGLAVQYALGQPSLISVYAQAVTTADAGAATGGEAAAPVAWPTTVYLVDCTACEGLYGGGAGGKAAAAALLSSLRGLLEEPGVAKVVHGCEQLQPLEAACAAACCPLLDTRVLLGGLAAMLGLPEDPPPAPSPPPPHPPARARPNGTDIDANGASSSTAGSSSPHSPSAHASHAASLAALRCHVAQLHTALAATGLWAERPDLHSLLAGRHFAALRDEGAAARRADGGWAVRPLGEAHAAVAAGAALYLPELWGALVEEAVPWVAVHAPINIMQRVRAAAAAAAAAAGS